MASELGVQTIQHTNGTDALTIGSDGSVTLAGKLLPSGQTAWPAFRVALTADQSETATVTAITVEWDRTSDENCYLQGGMSISTGVITVPVDGIYLFSAVLRVDNIGSGFVTGSIVVNDDSAGNKDTYIISGSPSGAQENLTGSVHFKLSAGDTVSTAVLSQNDTNWRIDTNSSFSGSLIAAE